MNKIIPIFMTAISLAACVKPDASMIGPYPKNYRLIIKDYVEKSFYDPYSLKSVSISEPASGHIMMQQGWVVCLQANAKNRMGGYTGIKFTAFLINNDSVIISDNNFQDCRNLTYSPWKELESK